MSSLLPPGFCFRPSEDQLLSYYLTNKNRTGGGAASGARFNGYDDIRELDLYEYYPFELPEIACYEYSRHGQRRRHWYCYAEVRALAALAEGRRTGKGGFWVMKGRVKSVFGPVSGALIGTRTKFVYYSGESATSAAKTGWVLYEYALVDHVQASFVLCRVFIKSRSGNSVPKNASSPAAEETAPSVRHIGVQHDGLLIPHSSVNMLEEISRALMKLSCDIDYKVMASLIPAIDFSFSSSIGRKENVGTYESTARNNLDTESDQRTPEDDFIELDDLKD